MAAAPAWSRSPNGARSTTSSPCGDLAAGFTYHIIRSDRRSFLVLAARFPEPPAAEFFTGLAGGETLAPGHLMVDHVYHRLEHGRLWLTLVEDLPLRREAIERHRAEQEADLLSAR